MLYQIKSTRDLNEIDRELQTAASKNKFGVIAVHNLQELMKNKGVELGMECRVYEVCNPVQAKKVLEGDGAISTALPCRISVVGSKGHYTLATMLPTEMMKAVSAPGLQSVAKEVEEVLVRMMQDAAG